jgi:hypothetical protein
MMGLVIFLRGNFGAILGSWSWLTATVAILSPVRRHSYSFTQADLSILQIILYVFAHVIYNIYFHPLAKFPGPKLAVISNVYQDHRPFDTLVSNKDLITDLLRKNGSQWKFG